MGEHRLVRFSVRWGGSARVMQLIMFVFFAALALAWAFLVFSPTVPWQPSPAYTYAGAPKVVAFLRQVHRSPVKPKAPFDNPF